MSEVRVALAPTVPAFHVARVQVLSAPDAASPTDHRRQIAWCFLWGVLAVLHVTQSIWLSGGREYPGDLGDGRFNQLVFEHGYQSLRGFYHWTSPGQFYPAQDTLGFSDTHAGTLPIYALLRLAGCSIERAWQAWFVVVAALNTVAAFRLFKALGISSWLRGPAVFAAVSSAALVWQTGTLMQMLPLFPALLAWAEMVHWVDDRRTSRLFAASGWFAWQFAAGPYLAFFTGVITVAVGLPWAIVSWAAGPTRPPPVRDGTRDGGSWIASVIFVAGWSLFLTVAVIYSRAIRGGAAQPIAVIETTVPEPSSWFTAAPGRAFYPAGWFGHHAHPIPHALFAGFLPWLLTLGAVWMGWKNRRERLGVGMLAVSVGALLVVLFFTRWSDTHPGAWMAAASHCSVLRAFRGGGRVAGLLQVTMVAAAGLLLTTWRTQGGPRWRTVTTMIATLLAVEGLTVHQPSVRLTVAIARADALIAAWRAAGDRPVLAYAFGHTNQSDYLSHLDAWSAALRLHRVTLNGVTGVLPGSHHRFIWNSSRENAYAILDQYHIPADRVSVVEHLGPEAEAALGIAHIVQRPLDNLVGFDLQPFAWKLYSPLEVWPVDGVTMYQLTPDAELRFHLPDDASVVDYVVGFRRDAYADGGQTDGAGVTWLLQMAGGAEQLISHELLTPVTNPAHRGLLERELALPPGHDRVLLFRSDTGPAHSVPWDFLLLGRLRVK